MIYSFKLFFASASALFLTFFIWKVSYFYGCYVLILPVAVLLIISHSFIESKLHERFCFRDCYFVKNSFFSNLLSSRFFVILLYLVFSIIMSVSILYAVIDFTSMFWIYLLFQLLIVVFFYRWLSVSLSGTVRDRYLKIFSKEWSIRISSLLLVVVYIYTSLQGYEPAYLRATLEETLLVASNTMYSSCEIIDTVLKIKVELDSMFWWSFSKYATTLESSSLKITVWISFIFMNSLAILGINRFMAQTIYLIDKLFSRRDFE